MGIKEAFLNFNRALTAHDVAEVMGVEPSTVEHWARIGQIPRIRRAGRLIRFDPEAMARVFTEQSNCSLKTEERQHRKPLKKVGLKRCV